jgi:hypothetical protein
MESRKSLINESRTYSSYDEEIRYLYRGMNKLVVNGGFVVSSSNWMINHPNGATIITFWLHENLSSNTVEEIDSIASSWASKHMLVAGKIRPMPTTFDRSKRNWKNNLAREANYVYSISFFSKNYALYDNYTIIHNITSTLCIY